MRARDMAAAALPTLPVAAPAARAAQQGQGDEGTIMPLVGYWPIWGLLGAVLVLAILAYYAWAILSTRRRRLPEPLEVTPPRPDLGMLRARALGRVDDVVGRYRAGRLSSRRAHAELSVIIRDFVADATGVRTDRMTLADLRRTRFPIVAHLVGEYYPIVFGPREFRGVDEGARAARSVIQRWL